MFPRLQLPGTSLSSDVISEPGSNIQNHAPARSRQSPESRIPNPCVEGRPGGPPAPYSLTPNPLPNSLAQYVITILAPARLIAVIASRMAASASSQPRSPAAMIAAYSPETW